MDRGVYRNQIAKGHLTTFNVRVKETDLMVHATKSLVSETRESVLQHRGYVEAFINENVSFATSLVPWNGKGLFPKIIAEMIKAGENANVGPMAAVAGAMAQFVGQDLLERTDEVIVENGGDIFIKTIQPITVGIFAGTSPLSFKIGIAVDSMPHPKAVCTSSGTIGHSLSYGKADAVVVVSDSCANADAAATAIGNLVTSEHRIQKAIEVGKQIPGVDGIIIIVGEKLGVWGQMEIVGL